MADKPDRRPCWLQVKEQLFRRLSGELPYELEPVPTEARRLKDGALLLKQTLFVRSESVRGLPCLEFMESTCVRAPHRRLLLSWSTAKTPVCML